jgi:hypothetical protein
LLGCVVDSLSTNSGQSPYGGILVADYIAGNLLVTGCSEAQKKKNILITTLVMLRLILQTFGVINV